MVALSFDPGGPLKRLFLVPSAAILVACGGGGGTETPTGPSTITIVETTVGSGPVAVAGDVVTVHYVGSLTSGTQFDNSYTTNRPITFQLGAGQVIPGFEPGVVGMRVGGKRRVTVPPSLAYGSQGNGPIPPNATLVFDIELVSIAGK
jgi:FKBP-type peptidyl-prolyl cis-trans isomerase